MNGHNNQDVYDFIDHMHNLFTGDLETFTKQIPSTNSKPTPTSSISNKNNKNEEPLYFKMVIPIVLSIFAVADVLGYLDGKKDNPSNTTDNLKKFFGNRLDKLIGQNKIKDFINLIRHGMVHSYFPKSIMGVDYFLSDPDTELFIKKSQNTDNLNSDQNGYYLNVKCLIKIVESRFLELLEKSKKDDNMVTQFHKLQKGKDKVESQSPIKQNEDNKKEETPIKGYEEIYNDFVNNL